MTKENIYRLTNPNQDFNATIIMLQRKTKKQKKRLINQMLKTYYTNANKVEACLLTEMLIADQECGSI